MKRVFVSLPDGIWKIINKDFKGKIAIIDNLNRKHRLGKVTFRGPKSPKFPA